jgi:hypothetical protein
LFLKELGVLKEIGGDLAFMNKENEVVAAAENLDSRVKSFFAEFSSTIDNDAKKAVFLTGVLAQHLLTIQNTDRGATPFRSQLKGLKMKEADIRALLPKIQQKLEEYKKNLKEDLDNKFSTSYETEEFNTYIQESLDGFKEDIFKEVYSRVEGEILKNLSNTRRPESSFKVENYDDSHKVGNFNQRVMNIKDITNEVFQEKSNSNPFQRVYKEIQKTE